MGSEVSKQEMMQAEPWFRDGEDTQYRLMTSWYPSEEVSKGANNCDFTTLVTAVKGLVTWYPSAAGSQTESGA